MSENKDEKITIRMDRSLFDALSNIANDLGLGISTAARVLLTRSIKSDPIAQPQKNESSPQSEQE